MVLGDWILRPCGKASLFARTINIPERDIQDEIRDFS